MINLFHRYQTLLTLATPTQLNTLQKTSDTILSITEKARGSVKDGCDEDGGSDWLVMSTVIPHIQANEGFEILFSAGRRDSGEEFYFVLLRRDNVKVMVKQFPSRKVPYFTRLSETKQVSRRIERFSTWPHLFLSRLRLHLAQLVGSSGVGHPFIVMDAGAEIIVPGTFAFVPRETTSKIRY